VRVTNAFGAITSVTAVLTLNQAVCSTPPDGLVSWWEGDGNGYDTLYNNDSYPAGALGFAPGKIRQAFNFDGSGAYAYVPGSSSLDVGQGAGMTIECWVKPADVNTGYPLMEWETY
jgi:hypothetical protein